MTNRHQLEERRAQAASDLIELDEQLASGEVDPATADRLRARYRAELVSLDVLAQAASTDAGPPPDRSVGRMVVGTFLVVAAAAGVVFLAAQAIDDRRPGEFVTGGIDSRDLSEVSTAEMEKVVTEFPNVVSMRVALARRYFDAGDFSSALSHYLTALEQDPTNPEALANLGWMTYLSDPAESATAAAFLKRSLDSAPGYAQAMFFLANVQLYGLGDPAAALEVLEDLEKAEDMPEDVAERLAEMVIEARGSL